MKKKWIIAMVIMIVGFVGIPNKLSGYMEIVQAETNEAANINGLEPRTKQDIAMMYKKLMPDLYNPVEYSEIPNAKAPYKAGKVAEEDLESGLDAINLVRYIAGLPADITLNEEYNDLAQHASVLNLVNNELTHYPQRPSDMEQGFYEKGATGARSSNIGVGYSSIQHSVISGYLDDSDSYNIERVGHRRWLLNPAMTQTGLGYAKLTSSYRAYTAMYAFDDERSYSVDYVAWPAKFTPVEIYNSTPAFSVSLGSYYVNNENDVSVTLYSEKENKNYIFGKKAGNNSAGAFYVSSLKGSYIGMPGDTIIFMPKGNDYNSSHLFEKGDVLTITIDGLIKNGKAATLKYTVELFSAEDTPTKPDAVENLKAISYGGKKVKLIWDGSQGTEGYLIYGQKNGKYGYVGMTTKGTTFTDVKALDNAYNFYWVFPYVKDESGTMLVGDAAKYVYAKGICPAVQNLKASSVKGGVKLNWTASPGAEGYLVYGIVNDGKYGYVGMTTKGTAFTDMKASSSVYNYYWVFPYHKNENGKMVVGGTPKYTYGRAV